jgi:hypothetical protein
MEEENHFPAIARALNILRERYHDQILRKQQDQENEQNDELVDEDSFVIPQTLTITPQPQETRPSIFNGLSERAKHLQMKQKSSSSTKLSPEQLMKVNALERVIERCEQLSIKFYFLQKWICFYNNRKSLQERFLSILEDRFDSEVFSQKFNRAVRRACIQRYGKSRLSQRYDDWRISRHYFYCWLKFVR